MLKKWIHAWQGAFPPPATAFFNSNNQGIYAQTAQLINTA
jgi:hypothetical protein